VHKANQLNYCVYVKRVDLHPLSAFQYDCASAMSAGFTFRSLVYSVPRA